MAVSCAVILTSVHKLRADATADLGHIGE